MRDHTSVPLAPKAFDILLYLLQNRGHLVKRDVLMEAIWPDSFVEETNITVNISLLRKTLGTMSDGQPYIETVPRKGYRFNAAATECEDADEPTISEPKPDSQKSNEDVMLPSVAISAPSGVAASATPALQSPVPKALPLVPPAPTQPSLPPGTGWKASASRVLLMSVVCIALVFGLFYYWSHWKSKSTVSASERSIAILPFRPLNPTQDDEYLGLGMTDALITRLSNLHKIIVRPVGAVRKYATADDPIAAGRQLAVQSVLEGSIQRSGDRTRVTVRLLRVADGQLLWGDEFDEKFTDMFTVEDSISQKVANALTINLSGEEQRQLLRPFTGQQ